MSRNRIKLNICGVEFALTADDSESYIRAIAEEVETAVQDIVDRNDRISVTIAALLTALNYCDERRKAVDSADNLRSQIKDYLEDSARARTEADEARRESERLKKELQTLRARLSEQTEQAAKAASDKPVEEDKPAQKKPDKPAQKAPRPQSAYTRAAREHIPGEHAQTVVEDPEGFMSFFEKKDDEQ
ncbi:cell division protein ZapA [Clostridium sp. D33t1_170424_F3]|uniref:cell division protein ZapA n=1 Tax=Clostridium sp. D33t1_170424_F3 TaxID=2787099 RepID=UPI0018A9589D|nr:cell division protein ZapA [Clostridium sp. D33t1_170424_F3]